MTSLLLLSLITLCTAQPISIDTPQGRVEGLRQAVNTSVLGPGYMDIYHRIPYARPPVNELRFKRPVSVVESPGTVINRGEKNVVCSQSKHWFLDVVKPSRTGVQSEDCLYLSVYSPRVQSSKLPVLVYLHGGSYQVGGSTSYDGSVLAQRGPLVVVIINYRLGPFGFLGNGDDYPGNNGIHDQIEALKWVQKYVSYYRGDPGKVTIMGHSAGGWSAGIHLISPLSKHLFHRVIIQSGSILSKMAWQTKESLLFTLDAVKNVLCMDDVRSCLTNSTTDDILDIAGFVTSVPWVDGELLTDKPETMIAEGTVNRVPVLLGCSEDEWARFITLMKGTVPEHWIDPNAPDSNTDTKTLMRQGIMTGMELGESANDQVEALVRLIQYQYYDSHEQDSVNRNNFLHIFSDYFTLAPSVRLAALLSSLDLTVYFYLFADKLPVDAPSVLDYSWLGAFSYHEVDVPFTFGAPLVDDHMSQVWFVGEYSQGHVEASMAAMGIVVRMCYNGRPVDSYHWLPYTDEKKSYGVIRSGSVEQRYDLRRRQMEFWNEVYPLLEKLTGSDRNIQAPLRTAAVGSWMVYALGVVIALLVALIVVMALCALVRKRRQSV